MHRPSRRSTSRYTKNFTSAAKTAYRHFDNAGSSFGRWITTDHTGFSRSMIDMPSMGFWDTLYYVAMHFLIADIGALVTGLMALLRHSATDPGRAVAIYNKSLRRHYGLNNLKVS